VTRHIGIDDATMRALERHETASHAIPHREMRDLGHAVVLLDRADPDPFWNRMTSIRWPSDEAGFDWRLTEMLALFAARGRLPHLWPSPAHGTPGDLVDRLAASGFRDVGGGHLMLLDRPERCGLVDLGTLGPGVTLHGLRTAVDAHPGDLDEVGMVLADAFGAPAGRGAELASDLRRTLDDPRITVVLVRVHGEAAACAKATTFDGMTYVSSVGTRAAYRGRGLAGLATRHALAIARGGSSGLAYLGVHSGNEPALRLYERLGFASLGESPDMLLG
jgi:ribosomal protein S18 acetylase RimI-like enzyme